MNHEPIMRRPPASAKSAESHNASFRLPQQLEQFLDRETVDYTSRDGAIYQIKVHRVRDEIAYRFERLGQSSRYLAHKLGVRPETLDALWRDMIAELRAERDRWQAMALRVSCACMGVA